MTDEALPEVVAVLPVTDLLRSVAWYQAVGFEALWVYEDDGYAILRLGGSELHLAHNPDMGPLSFSGCYLRVDDADEVHRRWAAAGAHIVHPPVDQPYRIREFAADDPDHNLWRVGANIGGPAGALDGEGWPAEGSPAEAPRDGSVGTGEDDWLTIVAGGTCAGCGLRATEARRETLGGLLVDEANRLGRVLTTADDTVVRTRPAPDRWSAMEYGAHVRDALAVLTERVVRALREDEPDLGWWDQDAAIADGWANDEEAASVADDVVRNATHLRDVLAEVGDDDWERGATRRGERFTVELLARYALHEVVHHRVDAAASIAGG